MSAFAFHSRRTGEWESSAEFLFALSRRTFHSGWKKAKRLSIERRCCERQNPWVVLLPLLDRLRRKEERHDRIIMTRVHSAGWKGLDNSYPDKNRFSIRTPWTLLYRRSRGTGGALIPLEYHSARNSRDFSTNHAIAKCANVSIETCGVSYESIDNGKRAYGCLIVSAQRNVLRIRAAEPFGECARAERGRQDSDAITTCIVQRKSLN